MDKKKQIKIIPFFSELYIDEEANRLSEELKYNPYECLHHDVRTRPIGRAQRESLVLRLFRIYGIAGGFVGLIKEELIKYDKDILGYGGYEIDPLIDRGYLREREINNKKIIFPTQDLLKTQEVPKYHV